MDVKELCVGDLEFDADDDASDSFNFFDPVGGGSENVHFRRNLRPLSADLFSVKFGVRRSFPDSNSGPLCH